MPVNHLIRYVSLSALFAVSMTAATSLSASECTEVAVYCTDDTPIVINGVTIEGVCKERTVLSDCDSVNPIDSCTRFETEANCTKHSDRCIQEAGGVCIEEREEWDCVNADPEFPPAQLLHRQARNVEDLITGDCQALADNEQCSRVSSTCTQPEETRVINHIPIARSCWGWERTYSCQVGETIDTCGQYVADPSCREVRTECLVEANGRCSHWDILFQCGEEAGTEPEQCEGQTVCIGGICSDYPEPESSDDFLSAQAWLQFLNEATKDGTGNDPTTIFSGEAVYCRKKGFGYKNCCSGTGWGLGLNLSLCREEEQVLKDAVEARRTVYIGTICVDKVLGYCISSRRMYCQFNSLFARVTQQQVRQQLGRDFGSYYVPNCNGLSIYTLENVDMEALDFSEAFPEIAGDADNVDPTQYEQRLLDRLLP